MNKITCLVPAMPGWEIHMSFYLLGAMVLAGLVIPQVRPTGADSGGSSSPAPAEKACSEDGIQRGAGYLHTALAAHGLDVSDVAGLASLWLRPLNAEISVADVDDGWIVNADGDGFSADVVVSPPTLDDAATFNVVLLSYSGPLSEPSVVLGLPLRVILSALPDGRLSFVLDAEQDGFMPIPPLASFRSVNREADGESRCACCNSEGPMSENDCTVRGCDNNSLCNGNCGQCKWVRHAGAEHKWDWFIYAAVAAVMYWHQIRRWWLNRYSRARGAKMGKV